MNNEISYKLSTLKICPGFLRFLCSTLWWAGRITEVMDEQCVKKCHCCVYLKSIMNIIYFYHIFIFAIVLLVFLCFNMVAEYDSSKNVGISTQEAWNFWC